MESVDSILLIPGTMANCYDVNYNGVRYLIDAGTKGTGKKLVSYFEEKKGKPDVVLITHYHPDHIGGLSLLKEKFNPKIFVPDGELDVVKGKSRIIPGKSMISRLISKTAKIAPVDGAKPLSSFKGDGINVLETGGHTPDSRTFVFSSLKAVFPGDSALMKRNVPGFSRNFSLDHEKSAESLEKILNVHGTTCYPGHGAPFRIE
ncbi:MAG: MBL fold metallo-hydrolase [Candidatus Thermoplasmatota archaeon]|nr:MBL fold metallo-hydrolase [Candidatus Thermoplasmatota archaeon]MCL5988341.1 MBL fold metallo-hydrolase [Candidatus Thermoplasmatota archaeon]